MKKNKFVKDNKTILYISVGIIAVISVISLFISLIAIDKIKNGFFESNKSIPVKIEKISDELKNCLNRNGIIDGWIRKRKSNLIKWDVKIPYDLSIEEITLKITKVIKKYDGETIENSSGNKLIIYIWENGKKFGELTLRINREVSVFKGNYAVLIAGIGKKSRGSIEYLFSLPFNIGIGIDHDGKYSEEIISKAEEYLIENWLYFKDDFINTDKILSLNFNSIYKEIEDIFNRERRRNLRFKGIIWEKIVFDETDFLILRALSKYAELNKYPVILIGEADENKEKIMNTLNVKNGYIKDKIIFSYAEKDEEIVQLFENFITENSEKIVILPPEKRIIKILSERIKIMMEKGYRFKSISQVLN